ncbi:hypothetical protein CAL26_21235 [Bordetella genomosp. 9]|uniref:Uncharacterized protein n=1 Tax=Bordetella genomosp. 9 TaxID=1416803 RepID=A0A261R567_9BORD|nr:hypothetical protein [Bordetella genomosp. 9]OZI20081.1 hypothetical protein CAL26_21235 [Bordetella genomosp. 9]
MEQFNMIPPRMTATEVAVLQALARTPLEQENIRLHAEVNRLRAAYTVMSRQYDAMRRSAIQAECECDELNEYAHALADQLAHAQDANYRKRRHIKKLEVSLRKHRRPWWHKLLDAVAPTHSHDPYPFH